MQKIKRTFLPGVKAAALTVAPACTKALPRKSRQQLSIRLVGIILFFKLAILGSLNVSAQQDSGTFNTDLWLSPDIPKVITENGKSAKPVVQGSTLSSVARIASSTNPDIPQSLLCQDLRVVFVLDESGSISSSEAAGVENGAKALANALLNSGATLQLVEFDTRSRIINLGQTEVNSTFITRLNDYLGAGYNGQNYNPVSSGCNGWTNWEDALEDIAGIDADLIIFFTDGNPTAYNTTNGDDCFGTVKTGVTGDESLDPAITQANLIKGQGKHMFVVGVGNSNEINLDNIKAISGNDLFGPSNDILTADYATPPFDGLAVNLAAAVNAICGTELLADKSSSNSGVCAGESVIFTNTVTNTGGDFNFTALNVVVKDVYPNGYSNLELLAPVPAGANITGGNTVNIPVGDMVAGATLVYQVKATVDAPPGNYNTVLSATAFNANEARDSVTVISGYATAELDTTSCEPVTINGETYSTPGTYTQTLVSAAGCDSILTIIITGGAPTTFTEVIVACSSYVWHGTTYYASNNTATWTGTNASGCDSIVTLDLTINQPSSSTEEIRACNSYTWHGNVYTESNNTATWTGTNAAGCDSVVTLNLTINHSTSSVEKISACNAYTWHGTTYTESNNTATWTGTNEAGCDSVVTLNLTVSRPSSSVETIIACNVYVWHGNTYTSSNNTATWTGVNAGGCDSVVTLNLTINKAPVLGALNCPGSVCRKQTGVQLSVAPVSGATSYTWVLPSGVTGSSTTNIIVVAIGSTFTTGVVKVTANTACGPSNCVQCTLTSPTAVPPSPGAISGPATACAAGNYTYSIAPVAGATSYVWSVTGTGISIYSGQGTTSIVVTVTSSFTSGTISVKAVNCIGSCVAKTLCVYASKVPCTTGPITGPCTGVCKKTGIVYTVPAVSGAASYVWTVPVGVTITGGAGTNSITVTFTSAFTGSGVISVKAKNACGTCSNATTVTVSALPPTPGAITGSASVTKTQTAVVYSIPAVTDATSYTWTITGGAKFVGSTTGRTVTVNFNTATSATAVITVKANNACGCSAPVSKTIAVSLGGTYARPSGATNRQVVTADEKKLEDYTVYPNPGSGIFNIAFTTNESDKVNISIMDVNGTVVFKSAKTYTAGYQTSQVNIAKQAKGVYYAHIWRNGKEVKTIQVLLQ